MLFENIDDKTKKDQKLSFIEKGLLYGAIALAKAILWKAGRVKTYGDLTKLGALIEKKMDKFEEKHGEEFVVKNNEDAEKIVEELSKATNEIKEE